MTDFLDTVQGLGQEPPEPTSFLDTVKELAPVRPSPDKPPAREFSPLSDQMLGGSLEFLHGVGAGLEASALRDRAKQVFQNPDTGEVHIVNSLGTLLQGTRLKKKLGVTLQEFTEEKLLSNKDFQPSREFVGKGLGEILRDPDINKRFVAEGLVRNAPQLTTSIAAGLIGGKGSGLVAKKLLGAGKVAATRVGIAGAALSSGTLSFLAESGFSFDDLRDITDDQSAAQTSEMVGTVNALLDVGSAGNILRRIPGVRKALLNHFAGKFAENPTLRRKFLGALRDGVVEGTTEGIQEVVANTAATFYDENREVFKNVDKAMFLGMITGTGVSTVAQIGQVNQTDQEVFVPPDADAISEFQQQLEKIRAEEAVKEEFVGPLRPVPENPWSAKDTDLLALKEDQRRVEEDRQRKNFIENELPLMDQLLKAERTEEFFGKDDLTGAKDSLRKFRQGWNTILQIAEENKHIPGLLKPAKDGGPGYVQTVQRYASTIRDFETLADTTIAKVWKLGGKQSSRMWNMALELSRISTIEGRPVFATEIQRLRDELGVNEQAMEVYQEIQDQFADILDLIEEARVNQINRRFQDESNQVLAQEALQKLQEQMTGLRNLTYFPFMRFGNFVVQVRAEQGGQFEGRTFRKGDIILKEPYRTRKERERALEEISRSNIGRRHKVERDVLDKSMGAYQGLPPGFIEQIRELVPADQRDQLAKVQAQFAPGEGFGKRLLRRKGVSGMSKDGARAYTSYLRSAGRFIASLQQEQNFDSALTTVRNSAEDVVKAGGDPENRVAVAKFMEEHRSDLMNPPNELNWLTALAFHWYMGFLPDQALINVTQLPAIAYPYLSSRFGDAKTSKEMLRAIKDTYNISFHPDKLSKFEQEAFTQAVKDGVIESTFAHESVALSEAENLSRMMPQIAQGAPVVAPTIEMLTKTSTYLFHKSELFNRRVTFLATHRLNMEAGKSKVEAYLEAKAAVQTTMFEYSRWNRPKFLKGKLKPLFVFWTFIQHHLNFVFGKDPGAGRAMMAVLFMAGLNQLPFAENINSILSFLGRQFNKWYGKEVFTPNWQVKMREELHDTAAQITGDPETIMADVMLNGAGRYGFGARWAGDQMGLHIPDFDISRSLGLGDIVPGINPILDSKDFKSAVTRTVEDVGGAAFNIPFAMMQAAYSNDGDALKIVEKVSPEFIANPLRAFEYFSKGHLTDFRGNKLPGGAFDPENPWHRGEIIGQALGLRPTRANLIKERSWRQREIGGYWQARRTKILEDAFDAVKADDSREAVADVRKAIKRFNSSLPRQARAMKIDGDAIISSFRSRQKAIDRIEAGVPAARAQIPIYRDIDKVFPLPSYEATEEPLGR